MNTLEMEIQLAKFFDYTRNMIVPNISYGLCLNGKTFHECDLLIVTPYNYLYEVEIKVAKADLIADKKKKHKHFHPAIKKLYFAIPRFFENYVEYIPNRAGIILVDESGCEVFRSPVNGKGYKITSEERFHIAKLGTMRIWGLKEKLAIMAQF